MYRILLDYGHGVETPGKRSPDGRLREYAYVREVGRKIAEDLRKIDQYLAVHEIVTEETDISLTERCNRVNAIVKKYPNDKCLLISIHVNAAGNGTKWMSAHGWSVFVHPKSVEGKPFADYLLWAAQKLGCDYRKPSPTQNYWTGNYKILRETKCPAILTENYFQDSKKDVDFLLSDKGKETVINIHVMGICDYLGIPYAFIQGYRE